MACVVISDVRRYNSGQMSRAMYTTNTFNGSNVSPIYQRSQIQPIHAAI